MASIFYLFCLNCFFATWTVLKLSSANTDRRYRSLNDPAEQKSYYLQRQLLQVVKHNRRKVKGLCVIEHSFIKTNTFIFSGHLTRSAIIHQVLQISAWRRKKEKRDPRGHLSGLAGNPCGGKGDWLR